MLTMQNGILEWKFLKKIDTYRQREFFPLLLPRQGQNLYGSRCFELVQNSSSCLFSSHSISLTATARSKGPPLPLGHVRVCKIGKIRHSWLQAILRRYYMVALFWFSIFLYLLLILLIHPSFSPFLRYCENSVSISLSNLLWFGQRGCSGDVCRCTASTVTLASFPLEAKLQQCQMGLTYCSRRLWNLISTHRSTWQSWDTKVLLKYLCFHASKICQGVK